MSGGIHAETHQAKPGKLPASSRRQLVRRDEAEPQNIQPSATSQAVSYVYIFLLAVSHGLPFFALHFEAKGPRGLVTRSSVNLFLSFDSNCALSGRVKDNNRSLSSLYPCCNTLSPNRQRIKRRHRSFHLDLAQRAQFINYPTSCHTDR